MWDVSKVADMGSMFTTASSFNGDLSKWDVSKVIDMSNMFSQASSFNGDLSKWDVSEVTDMSYMFASASSFNGDLSKWDVSKVTDMSDMFYQASSFNGDLSKWNVSNSTLEGMLTCCSCSMCDHVGSRLEAICSASCSRPSTTGTLCPRSAVRVDHVSTLLPVLILSRVGHNIL
jgi:surface protein